MKAGILSDTHDQKALAEGALSIFLSEGVEVIIHLGDVCSPALLERFVLSEIPLIGVFGNNDKDPISLQLFTESAFHRGPYMPELDGRKVLMAHSFDDLSGEIGEGGKFDLILFGHTHRSTMMRVGRALVLNPGEACGLLRGRPTCAVVDLSSMEARIVDIPDRTPVSVEPSMKPGGFPPDRC